MTTQALGADLIQQFAYFVDHPTVHPAISEEEADRLLSDYGQESSLQEYLKDKAVTSKPTSGDKVTTIFEHIVAKLKHEIKIYEQTITGETGRWNHYKCFFDITPKPQELAALAKLLADSEKDVDVFVGYMQERMIAKISVQLNKSDEEEPVDSSACTNKPNAMPGTFDTTSIQDIEEEQPGSIPDTKVEPETLPAPSFWQNVSACFFDCFTFLKDKFLNFLNWILD